MGCCQVPSSSQWRRQTARCPGVPYCRLLMWQACRSWIVLMSAASARRTMLVCSCRWRCSRCQRERCRLCSMRRLQIVHRPTTSFALCYRMVLRLMCLCSCCQTGFQEWRRSCQRRSSEAYSYRLPSSRLLLCEDDNRRGDVANSVSIVLIVEAG